MNISKISIITLTYKNWRLLDKAIASVANQIFDQKYKIEYLIVDDGTDDFDVDYVSSLLNDTGLDYQIIVNQHNIGTVASFNSAIKKTSGDIIVPLPADDEFFYNTTVNDIVAEFDKTNDLVITGFRVPIFNGIEQPALPSKKELKFFKDKKTLLRRIAIGGNIISGASTYYRRSIFDEVGFFDENFHLVEDYPFYLKILNNGYNIHFLNKKVIKYGTNGVSSVGKLSAPVCNDFVKCAKLVLTLDCISFFEKRSVYFSRILGRNDKKKIVNIIKYPEQLIFFFFNRFLSKLLK